MIRNDSENKMDGFDSTQVSDLYDCLSEIEISLKAHDSLLERKDSFEDCLEKVFGINLDQIDDIENIISNEFDADKQEALLALYEEFRTGLLTYYDRYLGIKFTFDDVNRKPDFNELYSVYKVMYLNEMDMLAKLMAYIILKNPGIYDLRKDKCFEDILEDDGVFNLDTIPNILDVVDNGNLDYINVFGDNTDDDGEFYIPPKVSFEWDVWISHIKNELNLGIGDSNKEILRNKILFYMDYIKENKLI